jgi:hypothetical protein
MPEHGERCFARNVLFYDSEFSFKTRRQAKFMKQIIPEVYFIIIIIIIIILETMPSLCPCSKPFV